jgi:hypothetical protein
MSRGVSLPLDSYRLAQYAVGMPCYICGDDNTHDAELCRHCYAPMALAHQARSQNVLPRMIATIGNSGAGKTVYLGMLLDMLSRQPERVQVLARGAFSITLQQVTVAALSRCQFPQKTPSEADRWNWVHCQVRAAKQKRAAELIMPDVAGEAIVEEIDHPFSHRAIRTLLVKCAGAMLLVDAHRLQEGSLEQDFFTMKLLCYLSELAEADPRGKRAKGGVPPWAERPVAVIFTKADECERCFENPAEYARQHVPGLWQFCRERFHNVQYFASGVAGACAVRNIPYEGRRRVPLRIEPRGIVEPFEWLVSRLPEA